MSDNGRAGEGPIRELKVSGHLMTLDPGLWVVFNQPGGVRADAAGFPGVRLSAAPGPEGQGVQVSTFSPDGWIGGDGGALVRVTGGRAGLMVTIYQAPGASSEAPKLQVVLLAPEVAGGTASGAAASAAPAQVAASAGQVAGAQALAAPAPTEAVEAVAHVYGRGDVPGKLGEWIGTPGSQRWIEGFGLQPAGELGNADVEYQAVLGRGWLSPWSEGGQFCGSRGMSLPILGMRVRLRGAAAKTHRMKLSATFVDGTRIGPVGSDEPCEAPSLAALEAFQVSLEAVAAAAATPAAEPVRKGRGKATKGKEPAAVPPVVAPAAKLPSKAPVKATAKAKPAAEPEPPATPKPARVAAKAEPTPRVKAATTRKPAGRRR